MDWRLLESGSIANIYLVLPVSLYLHNPDVSSFTLFRVPSGGMMPYIKCSNCGEIIESLELAPNKSGEIMGGYPYFCNACENIEIGETDKFLWYLADEDDDEPVCKHCGLRISPGRHGRREFCNKACKQAEYRKRKQSAVTPA
jgi:DNA-directed RNA polymerase subunit RPC12/RpoP